MPSEPEPAPFPGSRNSPRLVWWYKLLQGAAPIVVWSWRGVVLQDDHGQSSFQPGLALHLRMFLSDPQVHIRLKARFSFLIGIGTL